MGETDSNVHCQEEEEVKEMDCRQEKRRIRRECLNARDNLSPAERKRGDLLLTERILGHQWFYGSEYFLCFVSFGSEISTWEILGAALKTGKKVYVPKVLQEQDIPKMHFYRIRTEKELTKGYRGIPEPEDTSEVYDYSDDIAERTLMLMPGVAFDGYRNRLGYGKGFYDRYLTDKPILQMHTIAVGYRCQLTEKLPVSDTDIRPGQVICV